MNPDNYYRIPEESWFRLHFIRPRFKNNIENVLIYMAHECSLIDDQSSDAYKDRISKAIKRFPGNQIKTEKTIQNWRTEIPALFGFYIEDKTKGITRTSPIAHFLNEEQDLIQFFRLFLLSFQFPGGHLKSVDNIAIINNNIRFKPAHTIIKVLLSGNAIYDACGLDKDMTITSEEATYCIFNDLSVTTGCRSAKETAELIIENRSKKLKYFNQGDDKTLGLSGNVRSKGDMVRYAGDILDYMVLADILEDNHGYYSIRPNNRDVLNVFLNDTDFFDGYEPFYCKSLIDVSEISSIESRWFDYLAGHFNPHIFKTTSLALKTNTHEISPLLLEQLHNIVFSDDRTIKDIGDLGESIVFGHEVKRLSIAGYGELAKQIIIADGPAFRPGYDIQSYEGDGTEDLRYIEVKTTISKRKIETYSFHLTTHEWQVASTIKDHYCVYRLMLSENEQRLIILRDPVSLYKKDKVMGTPRNGMDITFQETDFAPSKILSWTD